jgi:hypothetical protein
VSHSTDIREGNESLAGDRIEPFQPRIIFRGNAFAVEVIGPVNPLSDSLDEFALSLLYTGNPLACLVLHTDTRANPAKRKEHQDKCGDGNGSFHDALIL